MQCAFGFVEFKHANSLKIFELWVEPSTLKKKMCVNQAKLEKSYEFWIKIKTQTQIRLSFLLFFFSFNDFWTGREQK